MTLQRADFWSTILWSYYSPQIESGEPFYLAADGNMIRDLINQNQENNLSLKGALQDFHDTCNALLEKTSIKAIVKDAAFQNITGKCFSRVICLAVQQVLVVELMLNDEHYSELSYFPRYRQCLGFSKHFEKNNPLGSGFFQRIWNTLEHELSALPGFSSSTITFFAGNGRDLNRNLPFSQALFTTHDLTVIRNKATMLHEGSDEKVIIQALYQVSSHLGRRAHLLISKSDTLISSRLCKQVRSFLGNYDRLSSLQPRICSTTDQSIIVAYLDIEDLFDDIFSVYLCSNDGQKTTNQLEMVLSQRIDNNGTILLIPRGDAYIEVTSQEPFINGDNILAIIAKNQEAYFLERFARLYEMPSPSLCKSNLSERFALVFCSSVPDARLCDLLGFKFTVESIPKIKLLGGLLANIRSQIYLTGYPPRSIKYDGVELSANTDIIVNNTRLSVGEFLESLLLQREFRSYVIQMRDDIIRFAISPENTLKKNFSLFGYSLKNEELGVLSLPLDKDQPGLRGTVFKEETEEEKLFNSKKMMQEEVLLLIDRGKRIAIPNSTLKSIIESIQLLQDNEQLADLATRQIMMTKSIPLKAVTNGFIYKLMQK